MDQSTSKSLFRACRGCIHTDDNNTLVVQKKGSYFPVQLAAAIAAASWRHKSKTWTNPM